MLWVKALHLIFVISWMSGLFYLPRLFVNHAAATEPEVRARLALMEKKLLRFTTGLGVFALGFGLWLWLGWWRGSGGWLHAKLLLVAGLVAFHIWCARIVADFAADRVARGHVWFRFFNEIPAFLMFAIVLLVVLKPF